MSSEPASAFGAITPSDSTSLSGVRALYVGAGGDVTVQGGSGQSVLFKAVPTGAVLPIQAGKVMSTGTTATNIVALY